MATKKTQKSRVSPEMGIETLFEIVEKRAKELGVKTILVASSSGETGAKASEFFQGYNVVVITHSTGFVAPDTQELTRENREGIVKAGGKILTTTHAMGGLGRAIRRKFETYQSDEIVANTLRIFGQGVKVAIEIAIMAADSGLISVKEDVISMGGTGKSADTALVLKAANVQDFFDVKVHEVIRKPWL